MSHEPSTVGKFAAQRANRQMAPLRRYLRQLADEAPLEARKEAALGREGSESSDARKEQRES